MFLRVLCIAKIFKGETEELAEKLLELELEIDEVERALSPHDFDKDLGVDGGDLNGTNGGSNSDAPPPPPPSFCDETSGSIPWHEALSVSIRAGEALYLPVRNASEEEEEEQGSWTTCSVEFTLSPFVRVWYIWCQVGWFHRVESGADGSQDKKHFHLALSYWFHPPDSLTPSFYFPYEDRQGWPWDWQVGVC